MGKGEEEKTEGEEERAPAEVPEPEENSDDSEETTENAEDENPPETNSEEEKDEKKTDEFNSTNINGIYAAGTVKGEMDYAAILMGDGYKTGINIAEYLDKSV